METTEKPEVAPLSVEEAVALTVKASALLDDVEDIGLRLMMFVKGEELARPMLPQVKMIASLAFRMNSEFVMNCYDRYGVVVDKSRHCDMPVSPPTGFTQALEVADLMVSSVRAVEEPFEKLFGNREGSTTNDALLDTLQATEMSKLTYTALDYALTVRGALVLMIAGFDFNAMNAALGIETKAPSGGSTRFGL